MSFIKMKFIQKRLLSFYVLIMCNSNCKPDFYDSFLNVKVFARVETLNLRESAESKLRLSNVEALVFKPCKVENASLETSLTLPS